MTIALDQFIVSKSVIHNLEVKNFGYSDHDAIQLEIDRYVVKSDIGNNAAVKRREFSAKNTLYFCNILAQETWPNLYEGGNMDVKFDYF